MAASGLGSARRYKQDVSEHVAQQYAGLVAETTRLCNMVCLLRDDIANIRSSSTNTERINGILESCLRDFSHQNLADIYETTLRLQAKPHMNIADEAKRFEELKNLVSGWLVEHEIDVLGTKGLLQGGSELVQTDVAHQSFPNVLSSQVSSIETLDQFVISLMRNTVALAEPESDPPLPCFAPYRGNTLSPDSSIDDLQPVAPGCGPPLPRFANAFNSELLLEGSSDDPSDQLSAGFPETSDNMVSGAYSLESDDFVTLLVRNIPARFSHADLVHIWPPEGCYNLIYMPYSFKYGRTTGCAFVNFLSHEAAVSFYRRWQGERLVQAKGKRLSFAVADLQGFSANLTRLVSSEKIYRMKNASHLPVVFDSHGTPVDIRSLMGSCFD